MTLAVLAAFGLAVPYMKGLDFLDSRFVLAYCSIGLLFAGPLMAEVLAADRGNRPAPIVYPARVMLVASYGWGASVLMLAMGFAVVNARAWFGRVLLPSAAVLVSALCLGLLAAIFVAELTALLTLKASAGVAKGVLRLLFLGILILIVFGPTSFSDALSMALTSEELPSLAVKISIGLVILNAVLLFVLLRTATPKAKAGSETGEEQE